MLFNKHLCLPMIEFNGRLLIRFNDVKLYIFSPRVNGALISRTRVLFVHVYWNGCGKVLYISTTGLIVKFVNSYAYRKSDKKY